MLSLLCLQFMAVLSFNRQVLKRIFLEVAVTWHRIFLDGHRMRFMYLNDFKLAYGWCIICCYQLEVLRVTDTNWQVAAVGAVRYWFLRNRQIATAGSNFHVSSNLDQTLVSKRFKDLDTTPVALKRYIGPGGRRAQRRMTGNQILFSSLLTRFPSYSWCSLPMHDYNRFNVRTGT